MIFPGRPAATLPGLPVRERCLVMGIVNVTPDSFADGGRWFNRQVAVEHGLDLLANGADLVDVGGESTRPGAVRPPVAEELDRVLPVIEGLVAAGALVSIDTMRAEVAAAALAAGAVAINDVSGGQADPRMYSVMAENDVPVILMHWRGQSVDMQSRAVYGDVVADVVAELVAVRDAAVAAGVRSERIALDPGIGFAKTADHNWALLRHLDALTALGHPVLVGSSRKAFLGALLAGAGGTPRPTDGRDDATAALSAFAAAQGAWAVRVHDARSTRDAVEAATRWAAG